jgi:thiamine-phosphate pyrophosphorylase
VEPGLYAIADADALGDRAMTAFVRRLLDAGPLAALQLRAKHWRARGVPLYLNDRPDVAFLVGTDGVHVGQDDLPVPDVRRVFPGLRVGTSTHDAEELTAALATDADYLAFGPVYGTRSKALPAPAVGTDGLRRAVERAAGRPVVAIGGITLANAPAVRDCGARAGAVISALLVPDDVLPSVVQALHRALGG